MCLQTTNHPYLNHANTKTNAATVIQMATLMDIATDMEAAVVTVEAEGMEAVLMEEVVIKCLILVLDLRLRLGVSLFS